MYSSCCYALTNTHLGSHESKDEDKAEPIIFFIVLIFIYIFLEMG